MGTLEVLNMEFSVVLWRRGVPVGVVYTGNNAMFRSEVFPQWTRTGGRMVLIRGGSDDGGVHPVLHLQTVFPVAGMEACNKNGSLKDVPAEYVALLF